MKKEILYVHGYNSSGGTGRALEAMLAPKGYRVHHFSIPQRADEAIARVKEYLNEHTDIKLVVGSSLGGIVTLQQTGHCKLVINPCLHPSEVLPKIGAEDDIAQSYLPYEERLTEICTSEERVLTYSMFSTDDELLNYSGEFATLYGNEQMSSIPQGKHSLSDEQLHDYVIPQILHIIEREV